jgi:Tfp pilus assembly protein FimT
MAELMMVVLIIGMMSYTISLSMDAMLPGQRLNTSVRALAGIVQGTRSDAIARNLEFWIEYDLEGQRYRVVTPYRAGGGMFFGEEEDEDLRFKLTWQPLETGVEFASVTVAGELFTMGRVFVRFDPIGATSDHLIVLTQPRFETSFTIEVLALTGLIRFHKGTQLREPAVDEDFN